MPFADALRLSVMLLTPVQAAAPPPPDNTPKFIHPNTRDYSVVVHCWSGTITARWRYIGPVTIFDQVNIKGKELARSQLDQLNGYAAEIGGDVLARVYCDEEWTEIILSQANLITSGKSREMSILIHRGVLRVHHRRNM